jgi:predicted O-methyltransferase YrrM
MSKFDEVTATLGEVPIMTQDRAAVLRDLMRECGARRVLELGTYFGKSAAYMAAILQDEGVSDGHVTTIDRRNMQGRSPNADDHVARVGLSDRVTCVYAKRSHTWEMARMLQAGEGGTFDFCYLDGGHTWDVTGFAFVLVDMLMRPGGIVVVDDLNWTIARTIERNPDAAKLYSSYSEDEKAARPVRLVWNTIVPHLGCRREILREWPWGIARKPA